MADEREHDQSRGDHHDRHAPGFVKNADVLAASMSAAAMFMPCANTSLGEDLVPLMPDDVCHHLLKLSMIAGIHCGRSKAAGVECARAT